MKFRLFSAFFLISGFLAAQTQVYVSPAGSDSNAGTLTMPFQTIQFAINSATPGTTIYLMGGTYYELVSVSAQGTAANRILLTNYNNQNAVISAPVSDSCCPLLHIHNANYFTVSGIEFSNYAANFASAITVQGSSSHIEIRNNKIHDIHFSSNANDVANASRNAQPVFIEGDQELYPLTDITVSGNEVYNCRTGYSEAIAVNGNVNGFIITANLVHDITNIGIDLIGHEGTCSDPMLDQARNGTIRWNKVWNCVSPYASSAGIYADGARDCVIENNICYGNNFGIEIGCEHAGDSAYGIIVRNNLVYRNLQAGIVVGGYDYPANSGKVTDVIVRNNTIAENTFGQSQIDGELVVSYCRNASFSSNLIYGTDSQDELIHVASGSVNLSFDFNLYYSVSAPSFTIGNITVNDLSSWSQLIQNETHSLNTDPLFVGASVQNYHLLSNSPAIDRGDSLYTAASGETDNDTMVRVQNGRIDIGADEFGTAVGIPFIEQRDEHYASLDPSTGVLTVMLSHPARRNGHVAIYNMDGRLVASTMIFTGARTAVLNTAELASGTYIVQTTAIESQGVKFVK